MDSMQDALWDGWHRIGDWVTQNDPQLNKSTIWALCVGFLVLGIIKFASWFALRGQQDRTGVGRALKTQKASEFVFDLAMGGLYGIALFSIYTNYHLNTWQQFVLRIIAIVGITNAAIFGIRFIYAYHSEGWGRATTGIQQALHDARKDDRETTITKGDA